MTDEHPLAELGWGPRWEALAATPTPEARPGRVVRHDGAAVLVVCEGGARHVRLRPGGDAVAVGDWVLADDDLVRAVLPRQGLLHRRDPSTGGEQPIAANVDRLVIVCGLDRPVSPGRIARFAALAWDAGAVPIVVLTKGDLDEQPDAESVASSAAGPGVDVLRVSSMSGAGLDGLRDLLRGQTVAFVGESGAGKSTLLNALAGREIAATADVRGGDHKGRHTTTARELHVLSGGLRVIDTPGVREVGLWTDVETVDRAFSDIAAFAEGCRFADCTHGPEPGCAVVAAAEEGRLDPRRLDDWHRLRREAAAVELRADPVAARRAGKRFGRMAREAQRLKNR